MSKLLVAGIALLPPAPASSDGLYWFRNPISGAHVAVKDEKIAAACEYIAGAALLGRGSHEFDVLRDYVRKYDPETYFALID